MLIHDFAVLLCMSACFFLLSRDNFQIGFLLRHILAFNKKYILTWIVKKKSLKHFFNVKHQNKNRKQSNETNLMFKFLLIYSFSTQNLVCSWQMILLKLRFFQPPFIPLHPHPSEFTYYTPPVTRSSLWKRRPRSVIWQIETAVLTLCTYRIWDFFVSFYIAL